MGEAGGSKGRREPVRGRVRVARVRRVLAQLVQREPLVVRHLLLARARERLAQLRRRRARLAGAAAREHQQLAAQQQRLSERRCRRGTSNLLPAICVCWD